MSDVGVIYKVYPKEGELEKALEGIKKLNPNGLQTEDVAFGIKVIKAFFAFDDSKVSSSSIEEKLKKIEGVNEVEVEQETLI
ncbi:MAG: elongation factor 1-beta family protein [Candidatus Marsarchaeota archaeon]|jgi:translation elongation factor EF-1beta|nr:elongation factor 1-beta family protein [Candidatus Marsarchaeota archaeon]